MGTNLVKITEKTNTEATGCMMAQSQPRADC